MSEGNGTIWGQRREVACPSGQKAILRLVAVTDLFRRGRLPLDLLPAPNAAQAEAAEATEDVFKRFDIIRVYVEESVVSPRIGEGGIPWEEVPDTDRTFLFNEVVKWQREVGGVAALAAGSFPG